MSQNISGLTGLTPNNFPTNMRALVDANLLVSVALAASAANAVTNWIDLGDSVSGVPYPTTETINVSLAVSASNNGNAANAAAAIGYIEHTSANTDGTANSTANAVIPTLGATNFASATSLVANSAIYKLPPGTKRFIRAKVYNNSGANLSDATATLKLLF